MDRIDSIAARIRDLRVSRHFGRVAAIRAGLVEVGGLNHIASVGDRVALLDGVLSGEIIALDPKHALVLPEGPTDGLSIVTRAELLFRPLIAPCDAWIGRIVDPLGEVLASASRTETIVLADVSAERVAEVRSRYPFLRDRRSR